MCIVARSKLGFIDVIVREKDTCLNFFLGSSPSSASFLALSFTGGFFFGAGRFPFAFVGTRSSSTSEATLYSSSFFLDDADFLGFAAFLDGSIADVDFFLGEGDASSSSLDTMTSGFMRFGAGLASSTIRL